MDKVLLQENGPVVTLTLNDPAKLNALDPDMAEQLRAAMERVVSDAPRFRCLVITGAGRGFCSGGSLGLIGHSGAQAQRKPHGVALGSHHHQVLKQLKSLPFPIVTAVNGPAAGLGFSYALAGDMIVASRSAFFAAAFPRLGVSPDGGLSWTLPRLVGWTRAKELLLLGRRLPAETALDWGLVNAVFDDSVFMEETMKLVHELASGPTIALGATRGLLWDGWANSYDQHLDLEERVQKPTFATHDAKEGAQAMLERRAPSFIGG